MFFTDLSHWPVPGGRAYTLEATAYTLLALVKVKVSTYHLLQSEPSFPVPHWRVCFGCYDTDSSLFNTKYFVLLSHTSIIKNTKWEYCMFWNIGIHMPPEQVHRASALIIQTTTTLLSRTSPFYSFTKPIQIQAHNLQPFSFLALLKAFNDARPIVRWFNKQHRGVDGSYGSTQVKQ